MLHVTWLAVIPGCLVAVPTLGQWNAALNCESRVCCLSACMGEVFQAIALVRQVLDWAQGCSGCQTGAQPFMVGLLTTPTGVDFCFWLAVVPPQLPECGCGRPQFGTAPLAAPQTCGRQVPA
jgi:hypothetical protein